MTEPLSPTDAHQTLDDMGLLDTARQSGVYALRLADPPDDPRAVFEAWTANFDSAPQHIVDGLADATRLAYVGQSGTVYDRLIDHTEGDVRQTAIMRVFRPVSILGVKAVDDPAEHEYNYARSWVDEGFDVWVDGGLI